MPSLEIPSELVFLLTRELTQKAVFSSDPKKPYGRVVLFQNEKIEFLLTAWEPGSKCWPHVHSRGLVFVLQGSGQFFMHLSLGKYSDRIAVAGESNEVRAGEIHWMGNCGADRLVCLHIYWPPVKEMWIYDPEMKEGWKVSEGGAWKPEPEHILEHQTF